MNENKNENTHEGKDLVGSCGSFLRLWGPPIVLIALGSVGEGAGWFSLQIAGLLWGVGTVWIGVICYINGKRCGRTHCKILGVLFPLLGIVGILIAFGLVPISWNIYWIIFWVVLILSFVPEFFGKKYLNSNQPT